MEEGLNHSDTIGENFIWCILQSPQKFNLVNGVSRFCPLLNNDL